MAQSRILLASLLMLFALISSSHARFLDPKRPTDLLTRLLQWTGGACRVRCSESSRPNLCKRACGTCCARCNCVPPDTYGSYHTCPCYAAMTTKDGEPKCP